MTTDYNKEYHLICKLFPIGSKAMFTRGIEGYRQVRIYGRYSVDAIKQALANSNYERR